MVVQHNLSAMNANRMLNLTVKSQAGSTEKLSSGYRINRAADDAAGLSISEKMRKQIRGLTQASSNAQDGISMVQTAEGALGEVHDMLQRMNELAVKAANGTLSDDDRQYIQNEVDQIMLEIDRVKESTKFNEIYVLKGKSELHTRQGYIAPIENDVTSQDLDNRVLGLYKGAELATLGVTKTINGSVPVDPFVAGQDYAAGVADFSNIKTKDDVARLVGEGISTTCTRCQTFYGVKFVDDSVPGLSNGYKVVNDSSCYSLWVDISKCNNGEDVVKAVMEAYAIENGNAAAGDGTHARTGEAYCMNGKAGASGHHNYIGGSGSKLIVVDSDTSELSTRAQYMNGAKADPDYKDRWAFQRGVYSSNIEEYLPDGKTVSIHVGADATKNNQIEVPLGNLDTVVLGLKSYEFDIRTGAYNWFNNADVTTAAKALKCITAVSAAIQEVSTQRSRFGAIQNRLEHTINNLDNVVENTTSAESQIRDTDMATEMVKYSNNNILAQAGQAMLAQANQGNQGVLSLLQ